MTKIIFFRNYYKIKNKEIDKIRKKKSLKK
jgi:hypothetical protein